MPAHFTKIPRSCRTCGMEFLAKPSAIREGGGYFCSRVCYHAARPNVSPDVFWALVRKGDGCWIWTGCFSKGYGIYRFYRQQWRTHRLAWALTHGTIPDGLYVLHNCPGGDNPACCNPAHLFLGTHADNMADKMSKGRQPRGEGLPWSKLTVEAVRSIRARHAAGKVLQRQLAEEYDVGQTAISHIVRGITWREVGP